LLKLGDPGMVRCGLPGALWHDESGHIPCTVSQDVRI